MYFNISRKYPRKITKIVLVWFNNELLSVQAGGDEKELAWPNYIQEEKQALHSIISGCLVYNYIEW